MQRWQQVRLDSTAAAAPAPAISVTGGAPLVRTVAGKEPSAYDGRVAFLLAFATAVELEVTPDGGVPEVVNALFCGGADDPLLVQRIGKAREAAAALADAPESGASGAAVAPSLGYVQRHRSEDERKLVVAAERAMATHWDGGRTISLPTPPPGFQWALGAAAGHEEATESAVVCTATLQAGKTGGGWVFSIGGKSVKPFDARAVISPCALDTANHTPTPIEPSSELAQVLRTALYVTDPRSGALTSGSAVLAALEKLHALASAARADGAREGHVFDWLPLACAGRVVARTWRDALLVLKTRDHDHVALGPVLADGTGSIRDMSEGVLIRLYHALEFLYPTVLIKEGALRWRVRPRGAGYHHMIHTLELIGRGGGSCGGGSCGGGCCGGGSSPSAAVIAALSSPANCTVAVVDPSTPAASTSVVAASSHAARERPSPPPAPILGKRPQRSSAREGSQKAKAIATSEAGGGRGAVEDPEYMGSVVPAGGAADCSTAEGVADEYMPLPQVTTKLWAHQEASAAKVVAGVKEGRRGHADASAVGAGKTLTALATIVRLAAHIEEGGGRRSGVLVMLPTKALIKEWLLEVAAHTSGFHVIEQREDGVLHSLTYGKSGAPIDGNSLVISTLDRVCEHPFVRQAAWDFVRHHESNLTANPTARPPITDRTAPSPLPRNAVQCRSAVSPVLTARRCPCAGCHRRVPFGPERGGQALPVRVATNRSLALRCADALGHLLSLQV